MENPKEALFLMQQACGILFSLANKLQIKGETYLKDLTTRQLMAMVAIVHLREDQTTLNNIAGKMGTTKQNVKQLITVLEKKGYVVTQPSKTDKRSSNVRITESGKRVSMECSERGIYLFLDIFKEFSIQDLSTLWDLLKKMYRFDGVEQDGFEEEVNLNMGEDQNEAQMRILKEFEKRRG